MLTHLRTTAVVELTWSDCGRILAGLCSAAVYLSLAWYILHRPSTILQADGTFKPVTRLAKWKTGFQMGALGTLLAGDSTAALVHLPFVPVNVIGAAMLWVAAGLTLVTGWDYLTAGLRHASGPARPGSASTQAAPPGP